MAQPYAHPLPPAPMMSAPPTQTTKATAEEPTSDSEPKAAPPAAAETTNYVTIKSPMVGTFYRSPSPDKDAFVKIGDKVSKGTVLCIIEAMKLFNEIESEVSGTIVKFLAEDAAPVEYDQPLFLIQP